MTGAALPWHCFCVFVCVCSCSLWRAASMFWRLVLCAPPVITVMTVCFSCHFQTKTTISINQEVSSQPQITFQKLCCISQGACSLGAILNCSFACWAAYSTILLRRPTSLEQLLRYCIKVAFSQLCNTTECDLISLVLTPELWGFQTALPKPSA